MNKTQLRQELEKILSQSVPLPEDSIASGVIALVPTKIIDNLVDYVWGELYKNL